MRGIGCTKANDFDPSPLLRLIWGIYCPDLIAAARRADMTRIYTTEEVGRHNDGKDLWIIIHGGVYDLTKFLKEHPGGEEVLLKLAGQDGTTCFDDIGHSEEAIQLREGFKIGNVSDAATATFSESCTTASKQSTIFKEVDNDDWVYEEPKYERSPWLPAILTAAGLATYAAIFYYMWF